MGSGGSSEGHLGTTSGRVDSGQFWVNSGLILDPILGNLINILKKASFGRG